uniref:GIY-YIG domain-containing protein n=1 Tax=Orbilia brochopaga TaxID=3140254 RepID=A0A481ZLG3_9PEZI|nr:hypothetical protein [Drechslerella brochopaga]QBL02571.1 hypothetical protein [Drechslerella brochopaga]
MKKTLKIKFLLFFVIIALMVIYGTFSSFYLFSVIPVTTYLNADTQKVQIIQENKNKSGIYCWVNNNTGKRYIGSSINLGKRLMLYYNLNHLMKIHMLIYKAILKYGHSKFIIEIIEYCTTADCLKREQYYLDYLKPEYNLAKDAQAPMLGRNHSAETKEKMSGAKTGKNHPMYGKAKAEGSGSPYQKISVFDNKNNITTYYNSMSEAAKALNIKHYIISKCLSRNQTTPYKGRYIFKMLKD